MKNISICTYAKNRLNAVKLFISYTLSIIDKNDQIVFVDFDDPEQSGEYVQSLNDDRLKVIFVKDSPLWEMNRARNIAGKHSDNELLYFMDIDIKIDPITLLEIRMLNDMFVFYPYPSGGGGVPAMTKNNFYKINGWDEAFTGYGWDDTNTSKKWGPNNIKHVKLSLSLKYFNNKNDNSTNNSELNNKNIYEANQQLCNILTLKSGTQSNIGRNWGRL